MSSSIVSNQENLAKIYTAMQEYEKKTCLKFAPYSAAVKSKVGHDQRIKFVTNREGCNSHVGMQGGKWGAPQYVNENLGERES